MDIYFKNCVSLLEGFLEVVIKICGSVYSVFAYSSSTWVLGTKLNTVYLMCFCHLTEVTSEVIIFIYIVLWERFFYFIELPILFSFFHISIFIIFPFLMCKDILFFDGCFFSTLQLLYFQLL